MTLVHCTSPKLLCMHLIYIPVEIMVNKHGHNFVEKVNNSSFFIDSLSPL